MAADKAKQVQKIRQLLALAEHSDTPDSEREAAFARAGMLMLKYEIEDADLEAAADGNAREEIVLYEYAVSGRGGHGRERAWALGDVAEGMGCQVAFRANDSGNRIRWILIVGPAATIDNLKLLLPAVLLQMENSAAKAARAHEEPAGLAHPWREDHRDLHRPPQFHARLRQRHQGQAGSRPSPVRRGPGRRSGDR